MTGSYVSGYTRLNRNTLNYFIPLALESDDGLHLVVSCFRETGGAVRRDGGEPLDLELHI